MNTTMERPGAAMNTDMIPGGVNFAMDAKGRTISPGDLVVMASDWNGKAVIATLGVELRRGRNELTVWATDTTTNGNRFPLLSGATSVLGARDKLLKVSGAATTGSGVQIGDVVAVGVNDGDDTHLAVCRVSEFFGKKGTQWCDLKVLASWSDAAPDVGEYIEGNPADMVIIAR